MWWRFSVPVRERYHAKGFWTMASFVSAAAVRDRSLDDVAAAIRDYAVEHKVECETIEVQQREAPAAEAAERVPDRTPQQDIVKSPEV